MGLPRPGLWRLPAVTSGTNPERPSIIPCRPTRGGGPPTAALGPAGGARCRTLAPARPLPWLAALHTQLISGWGWSAPRCPVGGFGW